jgi:hypothetical protein
MARFVAKIKVELDEPDIWSATRSLEERLRVSGLRRWEVEDVGPRRQRRPRPAAVRGPRRSALAVRAPRSRPLPPARRPGRGPQPAAPCDAATLVLVVLLIAVISGWLVQG